MANNLIAVFSILIGLTSSAALASDRIKYIFLKSADLPVTTFNLTFRVGSADDPKGLEGLADLTARLLREGGVKAWTLDKARTMPARTRAELEEFLFPFAADISVSTAKEQTSLEVMATAQDAEAIFDVLTQMVLAPAFSEDEFSRLKSESIDALKKQLPREDEEELGKAALNRQIFGLDHPYSHLTIGTVKGVEAITIEKVREFYAQLFTQKRLTVGVAGVMSRRLEAKVRAVFGVLPVGTTDRALIPEPTAANPPRLLLVKGPFDAIGVHLGQPLPFNRASADFAKMYLAALTFGKHRSFVGRLMHVVREVRGLNYGDYAYVEDFPSGGALLSEPTQVARSRQAFTIWGRPSVLENGCFLLRQLYREATLFARDGLTVAEFKLGRSHLVGNAPLLATGLERRLGYAIDSAFYGVKGDYLLELQRSAENSHLGQVNGLIRKYLHPQTFSVVVVTPDPNAFKEQILGSRCDIHYAQGTEKPKEVLAEDQQIATFPLNLSASDIGVVDSEELFVGK